MLLNAQYMKKLTFYFIWKVSSVLVVEHYQYLLITDDLVKVGRYLHKILLKILFLR